MAADRDRLDGPRTVLRPLVQACGRITNVSTSKFAFVRDALLERIDAMSPGEPMPAERSLAVELKVSRMTLRRALDDLVRHGVVVRRHGLGTFVAPAKVNPSLAITSFTDDMLRRGMRPSAHILADEVVLAGARLGRRLQVSPGERLLRVTQLRLADDLPMAIEVLATPIAVVPGLTGKDLENTSFYDLLQRHYGIVVTGGRQTIEPTVTDEDESRHLGVPLHSPAFLFERTSHDPSGRVVEFVRSVYRGDRYQIVTDLSHPDTVVDASDPDPGLATT
ncbi:MAG: UTRA domain-containing protein [Propionibacteriales bacterium]|nr:UTRA domain-containing protein [Propionibacteriales bacterium]